ncbi:hypothetical protein DM02DRAFT_114399 [Periconia macrospinosa]|uniref:Uncharacterized protein n=1 Tax=Periconia macrospinosa TaxID=97972 RepID=A0A2V1E7N4_9PLEO|nr:hypothetical protein DM02DRAFT_114399 [Periconia macrospinosa]
MAFMEYDRGEMEAVLEAAWRRGRSASALSHRPMPCQGEQLRGCPRLAAAFPRLRYAGKGGKSAKHGPWPRVAMMLFQPLSCGTSAEFFLFFFFSSFLLFFFSFCRSVTAAPAHTHTQLILRSTCMWLITMDAGCFL